MLLEANPRNLSSMKFMVIITLNYKLSVPVHIIHVGGHWTRANQGVREATTSKLQTADTMLAPERLSATQYHL